VTLGRTPSQTVGPYYAIGLSRPAENELAAHGDPGAVRLIGQLIDGAGTPISDGMIEIWDAAGRRGTPPFAAGSAVPARLRVC